MFVDENGEGACDKCSEGTYNLEESNPDGCTKCFCSGKTTTCSSFPGLRRTQIEAMDNWGLTSFRIDKTVVEDRRNMRSMPNYGGSLDIQFNDIPYIDFSETTAYFSAPEAFLRRQIDSYGGKFTFTVTYSGYSLDEAPKHPDLMLIGADMELLYHSGIKIEPNAPTTITATFEPYYWFHPTGKQADRSNLMQVLSNLKGVYIRASYGIDTDGASRLTAVAMDSAETYDNSTETVAPEDVVSSVEQCDCPDGYHGNSCQDCAVGYYRQQEDAYGPICAPCQCHGHAKTCHPLTGECVSMRPLAVDPSLDDGEDGAGEDFFVEFCHFRPDLCEVVTPENSGDDYKPHCQHHTTGPQCDQCAVGYYGDATVGEEDDCKACPCPLPENK